MSATIESGQLSFAKLPIEVQSNYKQLSFDNLMALKGEIVVDIEKCKGCEVCLAHCPTETIAMVDAVNGKGYHFMQDIHGKCTGCTNCAVVCPDGVITVYRVKV